MIFNIDRETLIKPLQLVSGVVERRQTLPVLSNVLLNVKNKKLSLTATDLEVEMLAHTEIEKGKAGDITLPARKFLDICRALPDQAKIEVSVDGERAVLKSGKSRFVLTTLPASDFPTIEVSKDVLTFSIAQNKLKQLIEKTHFAMAHQDVRYYLNGILMEIGENIIRLIATDGHRLALCEAELDIKINENQQFIIPRKGVMELLRLLGDSDTPAQVQLGSNFIRISTPEICFTSKLIDGRFPDYQNVVPEGNDKVVKCDRELLRQALNRVSILSNEKFRGVRFQFTSGVLKIFANNPDQEEAEEEVAIDYKGESLEVGFNVTYIMEAISACTESQVNLFLSDQNSCCLIQGLGDESSKYVVMPMRL